MTVNTASLIVFGVALLAVGGWVANIIKLIGSSFDPMTGIVIARVIGVFLAPLGAVLGFM